jgi:CBS domain-containing protein
LEGSTVRATKTPFLTLTAADLMTAPVMTLPPNTSLRDAARLLSESDVSGAPVVDAGGRCLGVISSSDFVTCVGNEGELGRQTKSISFIAPWAEVINIDESPDDEICRFMTAPPVVIKPETPIGQLAQKMVDAHIHRVLVAADGQEPCGIVTSTDVLAGVARTSREVKPTKDSPRGRSRVRRQPR